MSVQGRRGDRYEFTNAVALTTEGGACQVRHGLWEVRIPQGALKTDPGLSQMARERVIDGSRCTPEGLGLVRLLNAQGCFRQRRPETLSPAEVLEVFRPLRSSLYASYYDHPLWSELRNGTASDGSLTAWFIHNYHISRSAGPIAARMAAEGLNALAGFFANDALEEYWHCDSFYFVEGSRLALTAQDVKAAIPLPGSTAFEDLARRTAIEAPLAHVLIALFQEASVLFRADAEAFYDLVERTYALPGFFTGWRRHMRLDEELGHAAGITHALEAIGPVTCEQFEAALRRVQLTAFYLEASLDQIRCSVGTGHDPLRRPDQLVRRDADAAPHERLPRDACAVLLSELRSGAMRALGEARQHDEIMSAGRLASRLSPFNGNTITTDLPNPWLVAAVNFLRDRARDPASLSAAADVLIVEFAPEDQTFAHAGSVERVGSPSAELAAAQFRELLHLAVRAAPLPPLDVFMQDG